MKIAIVHLSDFHINSGDRFLSQKIDGVLCVDFISIEKFNMAINDHDLDEKLQKYAQSFAPYIIYPDGYKF